MASPSTKYIFFLGETLRERLDLVRLITGTMTDQPHRAVTPESDSRSRFGVPVSAGLQQSGLLRRSFLAGKKRIRSLVGQGRSRLRDGSMLWLDLFLRHDQLVVAYPY